MSDLAHSGLRPAFHASVLTALKGRLRLYPYRGASLGRDVRLRGHVWIHGGGRVEIRDRVRIDAADLPVELHAEPEGEIVIGEGAVIGGGTSIEATARVLIGHGVRIGRLCKVLDNSFHETRGDRSQRPPSQPVEIGAGAVIGDRAILLPGARVKPGQTVLPGAVVRGPRRAATGDAAPMRAGPAEVPMRAKSLVSERLRDPLGSLAVLIA